MKKLRSLFQVPGGLIRYGIIIACVLALWVTIPIAQREIRASQARNALAKITNSTEDDRILFLKEAQKALTPPGPTGELYDLAAQLALLQSPMDIDAAENLTKKALERSPARSESWARLAYIELLRERKLTGKAFEYLDHSFVVEPAGYKQFMLWRLDFMFAHWSQLPRPLQEATLRSYRMMALWRGKPFALKMVQKTGNQDLEVSARKALDLKAKQ